MGDSIFDMADLEDKQKEESHSAPTVTETPSKLAPKDVEPVARVEPSTSGKALPPSMPRLDARQPKAPVFDNFMPEMHGEPGPDAGEARLKDNGDTQGKRLEDATRALQDSKKLTTGEKIAMALVGLLPALGGGLIGAAINNPTSAAAGVAGGLEGSAKGVGMINQDVKDRVAQAQKDLEKQRDVSLDAQKDLLGRQLHNADYARGLKDQDVSERNSAGAKSVEERNNAKLHMFLGAQTQAGDNARENQRSWTEINKAKGDRADASDKLEQTFGENYIAGKQAIAALRAEIKAHGTAVVPLAGDASHAAAMANLPSDVVTALYQAQNPNARAVPDSAKAQILAKRLPIGAGTRNQITLDALDDIEKEMDQRAAAHAAGARKPSTLLQNGGNTIQQGSPQLKDVMGF